MDFDHYLTHGFFHWGIHKLCNVSSTVQKPSTTWAQVKAETQMLSSIREPMYVPRAMESMGCSAEQEMEVDGHSHR